MRSCRSRYAVPKCPVISSPMPKKWTRPANLDGQNGGRHGGRHDGRHGGQHRGGHNSDQIPQF